MPEDEQSYGLDVRTPNIARIYDAFLGGKDNFAADREVAARMAELSPEWVQACRNNRVFIGRAVTWAAQHGIRQFLDLGSGLPTHPAVHEVARKVIPNARVCYVDHDSVAVVHAQALLAKPEGITVVRADLADPASVLAEATARVIDLAEPVCVLFAMVLHFYPPEEARRITAEYVSRIAAGSALVISAARIDDPDLWQQMRDGYSAATTYNHSRDEVSTFFAGLDMVPPGLVRTHEWRGNESGAGLEPTRLAYVNGGVAIKR